MVTFQQELQTYEAALPSMLRENGGKFVVIHGTEICEVLPTYEEALDWAYDKFGLERFFVKRIDAEEVIAHFSRDLGPCGL